MKANQPELKSHQEYENQEFSLLKLPKQVLTDAHFTRCTFTHCDFKEARFESCSFEECHFASCTFNMSHFPHTRLVDSDFTGCGLIALDWSEFDSILGLTLMCTDCDLSYSVFSGVSLRKSAFRNSKIHEADFSGSPLPHTDFSGSDLERTRFSRSDLSGCDFRSARNYFFNPADNKCKNARFSYPEVLNLLQVFKIKITDEPQEVVED